MGDHSYRGGLKRYTAGSEALVRLCAGEAPGRLYEGADLYSALNAEMREEQLRQPEGIAAGRYLARLPMDRDALRGSMGSRIAYLLMVENLSPSEWRTGRVLQQQHGMPVPPAVSPPGGKETVLLDIALPGTPGLYELFVDVVEEGVCYFSDRGSPPLVCEDEVVPGAPMQWRYRVLVEQAYLTLLGREPRPEEVAHWQKVLEDGGRLECLFSHLYQGAAPHQNR